MVLETLTCLKNLDFVKKKSFFLNMHNFTANLKAKHVRKDFPFCLRCHSNLNFSFSEWATNCTQTGSTMYTLGLSSVSVDCTPEGIRVCVCVLLVRVIPTQSQPCRFLVALLEFGRFEATSSNGSQPEKERASLEKGLTLFTWSLEGGFFFLRFFVCLCFCLDFSSDQVRSASSVLARNVCR